MVEEYYQFKSLEKACEKAGIPMDQIHPDTTFSQLTILIGQIFTFARLQKYNKTVKSLTSTFLGKCHSQSFKAINNDLKSGLITKDTLSITQEK